MDSITTSNSKSLESKYAAKKRAKRLGTTAAAKTKNTSTKKGGKKSTSSDKKSALDVDADLGDEYWSQYLDAGEDALNPFQRETDAGDATQGATFDPVKVGRDANKINQYYMRFPQTRQNAKGEPYFWSGFDSPKEIEVELARIHSILNGDAAEESLKTYMVLAAKGIEGVTHTYQYNPMNLDVHYLGDAVAAAMFLSQPGHNPFDPELAELAIEYSALLSSGPEMRFLIKLGQWVWQYSEARKKGLFNAPPSAQAPPQQEPEDHGVAAAVKNPNDTKKAPKKEKSTHKQTRFSNL